MSAHSLNVMFPHGIQGIIFDCDGVLFDSRESNIAYYNNVLAELGLAEMTEEQKHYIHMASGKDSFEYIVPKKLHPYLESAIKTVDYEKNILPMLSPAEGLYDLLEFLNAYGVPMALATNRSKSVELLLNSHQLFRYFSPIMTSDRAAPKPSPEPLFHILDSWKFRASQVAFIGDTEVDMLAAASAKMPFWSFGNLDLVANLHLSKFSQLMVLLEDHFQSLGIDLLTRER